MEIRFLQKSDLDSYVEHLLRHFEDNGRDGVHYTVFSKTELHEKNTWLKRIDDCLSAEVLQEGWGRAWGLFENDKCFGHLSFVERGSLTSRHRCTMGMGLEFPYHRKGWGSRMLEMGISWARETEGLDYIDLNVFEKNYKAKPLYDKFGFIENGRVRDLFRIDGHSLTDIKMTLKVT